MKYIIASLLVFSVIGLMIPSAFAESVPSWVKNTAGWWATDQIDDSAFLQGIQYLIKEGIMVIPPTETSESSGSQEVPSWIKNNAGWWDDGLIDDSSFVSGIQWLISNGIIVVEGKLIHTDVDFRVAFIGDQGLSPNAIAVLNLIKDEGAQMVLHQGDFDYKDDPTKWDRQISNVLGSDFPYFASVGNHDLNSWDGYQEKLYDRLKKNPDAICNGDLGVKSSCTYKGLFFILAAPGLIGSNHDSFIEKQLNNNDFMWRICSWHVDMQEEAMKFYEIGWEVYESCKNGGAIIANAHLHFYARSNTLIDFENQIVDPKWSKPDKLRVKEGATFTFVSGLGGYRPVAFENSDLIGVKSAHEYHDWTNSYTPEHAATNGGALFCTFNVGGQPNKAYCYFKNIDGRIIDAFTITNFLGTYSDNTNLLNFDKSGMNLTGDDLSNSVIIDANLSNTILVDADLSNSVLIGTTLRGADLTGANLSGIISNGKDLTGSILRGADLTGANIAGIDLSGMDLTGTILRGADLTGANLAGIDLAGRDLTGTILRGLDLTDKDLTGTILRGADLTGANLAGIDLAGRDLTGTILRGLDLTDKDLTGTILRGADLTGANLAGIDLAGRDLTGTILRGADLTDANLAGIDLAGMDLSFAILGDLDLTDKDLTGTILRGADLTDANLAGIDLAGMDLSFAILGDLDLTDKDLTGTILTGLDLTDKDLTGTILRGADFTYANLSGIDLSGRDLTKAKFNYATLVDTNLENVNLDHTSFVDVDLTKIKNKSLAGANLTNTSFAHSNLSGVSLDGIFMQEVNFWKADLSDVDFTVVDVINDGSVFVQANLSNANFEGVNLAPKNIFSIPFKNKAYLKNLDDKDLVENLFGKFSTILIISKEVSGNDLLLQVVIFNNFARANLIGADFSFAKLDNVNFANADFYSANLTNANLSGADLRNANLTGANLIDAYYDENTIWKCIGHHICN